MGKVIDADKLKEHYSWWPQEDRNVFDTIVDLQPEVVVRCKDCKHYLRGNGSCNYLDSKLLFLMDRRTWDENSYCSWGERKEGEFYEVKDGVVIIIKDKADEE